MSAGKHVKVEMRDGIRWVTVSRPEALNALNREVLNELKEVFSTPPVAFHIVILTGEGKAFVAGADIGEMADMGPMEAYSFSREGQMVFSMIEEYPYPVMAAINGYALGGGLELAMACDIRIASDRAKLGQPEVNLGVIPGFGGTQRLPRIVGMGRALELLYTGKMISAEEALSIGLVNAVCPQEELLAMAENLAKEILKKGPLAIKSIKWAVRSGLQMPLKEALQFEALAFSRIFSTEDQKEGMKAFLEKRKAEFKGR